MPWYKHPAAIVGFVLVAVVVLAIGLVIIGQTSLESVPEDEYSLGKKLQVLDLRIDQVTSPDGKTLPTLITKWKNNSDKPIYCVYADISVVTSYGTGNADEEYCIFATFSKPIAPGAVYQDPVDQGFVIPVMPGESVKPGTLEITRAYAAPRY